MTSSNGGRIRINLGCGACWHPGWRNVDNSPWARLVWLRRLGVPDRLLPARLQDYPRDLVRWDLRRLPLPFAEGSAEAIYSSFVLEYLTVPELRALLRDCRRVLAPGGVLRLAMADFRKIVEQYLAATSTRPSPEALEAVTQAYSLLVPERDKPLVRLVRRGGIQQVLDPPALQHLLREAGFDPVEPREFRQGRCPDLDQVERKHPRYPFMFVEATVPQPAEMGRGAGAPNAVK